MEGPGHRRTTLDNGLRIVTETMPSTRSVAVSIYVGAGSRYETPEQAGMSHLLEHLLFKGTTKRPTPQEISEPIDDGSINNTKSLMEDGLVEAAGSVEHMRSGKMMRARFADKDNPQMSESPDDILDSNFDKDFESQGASNDEIVDISFAEDIDPQHSMHDDEELLDIGIGEAKDPFEHITAEEISDAKVINEVMPRQSVRAKSRVDPRAFHGSKRKQGFIWKVLS